MPRQESRAHVIVARLSEGNASPDEVFEAFEELDRLPADVVRDAFEPWTGPAPDLEKLDDALRRAHRLPLRTPRLRTLESARDADVLDLGTVAEEQLRVAGKTWDGQDLEPWDRLDGERDDSFAGTLERRVLGEGGKPLFDAMLFGEGSGVIFRTGTTEVVGMVADHRVESTDRAARTALEVALRETPAPSAEEQVPSTVAATSVATAAPVQVVVAAHRVPAPVVEEPIPSTVAAAAAARQVELPFAAPPAAPLEAPPASSRPAPESSRTAKPKKVAAKKRAAPAPPSEPAPKKKTVAKKKAAAAVKAPAAKKTTVAKKKTATKKKTTRSSAE